MIRGAIFDLDGTLIDSMFIWDTVGEEYLRSLGIEPKDNLAEEFRSMSLYQAAVYTQREYGVRLPVEEIMDGVNRLAERYYLYEVPAKPHVREFLEELKAAGVRMCVATATDRYLAEAALRRCGIMDFFTEIFTCTEVGSGKDEPFIYREAIKRLGTDRDDTVVFEDSLHALMTAKNDGFITAAIYDAHEPRQKQLKDNADYYMRDFSDNNKILCVVPA